MVLVDSSVWIEALRREGDLYVKCALEGLLNEYEATFCSPVRLEVMGGARKEDRKKLESYFSVIPYLQAKEDDWIESTRRAWHLAEKGVRVPWYDLLIATMSMRIECRVYSLDKHFKLMAKYGCVVLYEPGYGGSFSPDNH